MERMSDYRVIFTTCTLCACLLCSYGTHIRSGACSELHVPQYGVLIFTSNGTDTDVTISQPSYVLGDVVEYKCATGYLLVDATSGQEVSNGTTVCQANDWTIEDVTCNIYNCSSPPPVGNTVVSFEDTTYGSLATYSCNSGYSMEGSGTAVCTLQGWINMPSCDKTSPLSQQEISTILGVGLGAICLLLSLILLLLCCQVCRLRLKLHEYTWAEDEIALARSQGTLALSNPLVGMKDEDVAGNPLYLTPDELNEFEQSN